MPAPDLSVIIVSWNTRDLLRDCLASVTVGTDPAREILVVDNGSGDGSVAMVEAEFPTVRVIPNPVNVGFARANNQALGSASGRYVLLLNPDASASPGALGALVAFMDAHPEAGACGPRLVNPDRSLQPSGRSFPSTLRALAAVLPVGRRVRDLLATPLERRDHRREAEVDEVSGAALCLRSEALAQVGLLDEGFFLFGEDVDLCWRLRKAGWHVCYVPGAEVVHVWGGSRTRSPRISQLNRRAWLRLMRKHRPGLPAATVAGVIYALTLGEGVVRAFGSWARGGSAAAGQAWHESLEQLAGLRSS